MLKLKINTRMLQRSIISIKNLKILGKASKALRSNHLLLLLHIIRRPRKALITKTKNYQWEAHTMNKLILSHKIGPFQVTRCQVIKSMIESTHLQNPTTISEAPKKISHICRPVGLNITQQKTSARKLILPRICTMTTKMLKFPDLNFNEIKCPIPDDRIFIDKQLNMLISETRFLFIKENISILIILVHQLF